MGDIFWKALWEVLAIALFGAILYCIDRSIGRGLYRGFYKWTHRDPLPSTVDSGGILCLYNRKTEVQVKAASVISVLTNVILMLTHQNNWLFAIFMMVVDVPGIVFGATLCGPTLYRMFSKLPGAFKYVDAVQEGKINPLDQAADAAMRAAASVTDPVRSGMSGVFGSVLSGNKTPDPTPPVPEVPKEEENYDPMEAIRRFTKQ